MIDIFTTISLIMTAGKVTHTMDVSWVWVFAPLYARASLATARFIAESFREP